MLYLYDAFTTLHSVYVPFDHSNVKSKISMTIDKTKQLLHTLKWQASAVSGQSYDKMNEIGQCRGFFFCKFGCFGKDYYEAFNFHVQILKKHEKRQRI